MAYGLVDAGSFLLQRHRVQSTGCLSSHLLFSKIGMSSSVFTDPLVHTSLNGPRHVGGPFPRLIAIGRP